MNNSTFYCRLAVAAGLACSVQLLLAAPADLSVSAHKRFIQNAKMQIEKQIKNQFADQEAAMETMSTPFKIGDEVTLTIQQGRRLRKVTGKFKDFDGFRAHIGETSYLLSDISKVDADRVRFGKHPELLQLTLENMRRELELEKAKVREVSLQRLAREAGYTENFLEDSIELGGRYWPYEDLGEDNLTAYMNISATEPYVDVVIQNETGTACATVFILGKQAVSSTLKSDGKSIPEYEESSWSQHRFRLKKEDLGDDPVGYVKKNLRLWSVRNETGSWQFTCGGVRKQGSRATLRLDMPRLRVKRHSAANPRNVCRYSVAAARYQQSIESVIEAAKAERAARQEAEEAEARARADDIERRKNERIAATKRRKEAERDYIWMTADQAKQLNVGRKLDRQVLTSEMFNDVNYPSQVTIDDKKYQILRMTDWEKRNAVTPDRDRLALCEVIAMKFRVMRLMYVDTYERKVAKLKAEGATADGVEDDELGDPRIAPRTVPRAGGPRELYDEFGPGGPGGPGFNGGSQPGVTAADVVDEGTAEFFEKLEEIDEEDEKDDRPDPGYLVQYRASFQNTLSESVEYVATITLGFKEGEDMVWTDKYRPISQYLGPIYGNRVIKIEDLKRGVDKIKLEGKVTGGEEIRERRKKELEEAIKNQPTGPVSPGGGSGGPGRKKPSKGLFD